MGVDLPLELWLEILAHLPRSSLYKVMGLNRFMFELAMNDLYEVIDFTNDDERMRRVFQQLQHSGVKKRVRRLKICPRFLLGLDEKRRRTPMWTRFSQVLRATNHVPLPPSTQEETMPPHWDTSRELVALAKSSLKGCLNIKDLSTILTNSDIPSFFLDFHRSLFRETSIGPQLTAVTIDTTIDNLDISLAPLIRNATHLNSLDTITIHLSITHRDPPKRANHEKPPQLVGQLATGMSAQLRNFTLSSDLTKDDLSPLFHWFPVLPALKRLDFLCVFSPQTIPNVHLFTKFISRQAGSLEHLVVSARGRGTNAQGTDRPYYYQWIAGHSSTCFGALRFPHLRTLEIDLDDTFRYPLRPTSGSPPQPSSLIMLHAITPALTSLTIRGAYLYDVAEVRTVINGLPKRDGACSLETLNIWVSSLTCSLFDYFDKALPNLLTLELRIHGTYGFQYPYSEMRARRYPNSPIRYLRVTWSLGMTSCPIPHPCRDEMKAIAEAFPHSLYADYDMKCDCEEPWSP